MSDGTFADLFCGAGLFSAGFQAAAFRPVQAIDLDEKAIASYRGNVASIAIAGDARNVTKIERADVLLAGPPCQGFSTLGQRDPKDERNKQSLLVPDWAYACQAKIVVVENVPPFLQSQYWRQMAKGFQKNGYDVDVWVLDAADFKTPQRRLRAFTVASKAGRVPKPRSGADRLPASVAFSPIDPSDPMHIWPEPSALARLRFGRIPKCGDKRDLVRADPRSCPPSWLRMGIGEATDVWGRIDPSKPSNTLRCRFQNPSTGRYIHPIQDRVISVREGARLQGVPDSWVFQGNREAMTRQIGNGVPIPLAAAVAKSVRQALARCGA